MMGERLVLDIAFIGRCQYTVHMHGAKQEMCNDDLIQTSPLGLFKPPAAG